MTDISFLANSKGFLKIIALDHRGSINKIVETENISNFKLLCTKEFMPYATAVLVDQEYGLLSRDYAKSNNFPVIWTAEQTGYVEDINKARTTKLYDNFNPTNDALSGINAIKLLLYFNPIADNATDQIKVAQDVYNASSKANLPVMLEIITYPIEGKPYNKLDSIIQSVQKLRDFTDILKLEFPIDITDKNITDTVFITESLSKINKEANKPWVLLSKGMEFSLYKTALKIALENGARGYAVGRAVWQEVGNFKSWQEKENFIKTTAVARMKELSDLC